MKAFQCDCCGGLATVEQTLQMVVELPGQDDENGSSASTDWQRVEICRACLDKPAWEVLGAACAGLADSWLSRAGVTFDEPEAS